MKKFMRQFGKTPIMIEILADFTIIASDGTVYPGPEHLQNAFEELKAFCESNPPPPPGMTLDEYCDQLVAEAFVKHDPDLQKIFQVVEDDLTLRYGLPSIGAPTMQ